MRNLNQVTVQGNLGKTPEIKENEFGKVAYLSVACTNTFKNDKNEEIKNVVWVNVKAKGKSAEYVSKYFKKGDKVTITGELRNNTKEIEGINYTFTSVLMTQIFKDS